MGEPTIREAMEDPAAPEEAIQAVFADRQALAQAAVREMATVPIRKGSTEDGIILTRLNINGHLC